MNPFNALARAHYDESPSLESHQGYRADMSAADLAVFIRSIFTAERADSIIARMGNGATYGDALYSTGKNRTP